MRASAAINGAVERALALPALNNTNLLLCIVAGWDDNWNNWSDWDDTDGSDHSNWDDGNPGSS